MRSVIRVLASRPLLGHWRSKLAVAATLVAALTIGIYAMWHGLTQTAYALDDLPSRLLEIKSIYMTGWMFEPNWTSEQGKDAPKKYPMKMFAERPDFFWHMSYGFSGPDKNHKDVRVRSSYVAGKGTRMVIVSDDDKTAVETTVATIENELSTEETIQVWIPQELLSGRPRDFVKTGSETIGGVPCDVYERVFDKNHFRNRVWLDPKTGLPVKIELCEIDATGGQTPKMVIDHVEVNVAANATGLSFDPPQGYQVIKAGPSETAPSLLAVASGGNDGVTVGTWHCFNIDDKAVLLGWRLETPPGAANQDAALEFRLGETRPCDHVEVASGAVGDAHWRWSLAWPKQPGERIGDDSLSVIHRAKQGGTVAVGSSPLRFRDDRLRAILEEVQRLTNATSPGSSAPFSLDTLRAKLPK